MKKFFIALCLFLFSVTTASALELRDYALYLETTGTNIVAKWDDTNNSANVEYEVRLYSFERQVFVAIGKTTNDTITFALQKSGHYTAYIRANFIDQSECGNDCYTDWVLSTDLTYATVNGAPRGWWVYGYLAAPGPIIIE